MDRRTAIQECKALWKTILEVKYRNKNEALAVPEFAHIRGYQNQCPLCEYDIRHSDCHNCPLYKQLKHGCYKPFNHDTQPREFAAEVMKLKVHGK